MHSISTLTAIALQNITLSCSASIDDVTYSWHRVDDPLPLQSQGQDSNTFTIHRATPHDEGMYYCVAKKNGISVQSNSTSVQVNGRKKYIP